MKTYNTYKDYLDHQKEKTTNPQWRKYLFGEGWNDRKFYFKSVFQSLVVQYNELSGVRALGVGARTGQEIEAMRELGFDGIGVDLVPCSPLVIAGDFHNLPFEDSRFGFIFTNSYDHALYPGKFVSEIIRVSKPGCLVLMHLAIGDDIDGYSCTFIYDTVKLREMFEGHEVLKDNKMTPWGGLNWELLIKI